MIKLRQHRDYSATPEQAWQIVGDFEKSARLDLGIVDKVEVSGRSVGDTRVFHLADAMGGGSVSERLVALDDTRRTCTYEITSMGPLPYRRYTGRIWVTPKESECTVNWSADIDPVEGADHVDQLALGAIQAFFDALATEIECPGDNSDWEQS